MDNEIYQLVKHLSQRGLDNLTSEEKLIKLWQRAVKKWNKSHEPTSLTLEEVYHAFKNRWPQIYGGEPLNGTLYLSFSYIDYYFTRNSKGQICGGIWPRIDKKPKFPLNMTTEQIVDLASILRIEPRSVEQWELSERYVSCMERSVMERDCKGINCLSDKELYYFSILQTAGKSLNSLGLFEDSIITLSRSLICRLRFQRDRKGKSILSSSLWDKVEQAGLYTTMADDLAHMFLWDEAEWCFTLAYEYCLDVFENADWQNIYEKDFSGGRDRAAYLTYYDWACRFAEFYKMSHRPSDAISILEKAEAVAKDMNEIEEGRWTENLESIKNKLATIRENANK